jgi:hypothetical protein
LNRLIDSFSGNSTKGQKKDLTKNYRVGLFDGSKELNYDTLKKDLEKIVKVNVNAEGEIFTTATD